MNKRYTTLLADDHTLVRVGIKVLLDKLSNIGTIIECGDGLDVLTQARQHQPQLVLLDITLPGLNGLEVAERLREQFPRLKILMLSMHAGPEYVARAWLAGANGYLVKDSAFEELAQAIDCIMRGERYLSKSIDPHVVERFAQQQKEIQQEIRILTPRQRQILQLIAEGNGPTEMSKKLHVSVKTIESHRAQLMDRLGIYDVPGLVKFAIRCGLIETED